MELMQVAKAIEDIIAEIGKFRKQIEDKGILKAQAIKNYDMKMDVAIVELKDEGVPVTLIRDRAKGKCAEYRYELELAEAGYKACISNIEALKAQLNGCQSIFRYLDEMRKVLS